MLLALSWRWPSVGGLAFTLLGALYLAGNWNVPQPWPIFAPVAGALLLLGALFALSWVYRRELR